jgi:hypothetical protein
VHETLKKTVFKFLLMQKENKRNMESKTRPQHYECAVLIPHLRGISD